MKSLKKVAIVLSIVGLMDINALMGCSGARAAVYGCMTRAVKTCRQALLWLEINLEGGASLNAILQAVPGYDNPTYAWADDTGYSKIDKLSALARKMKLIIAEATRPCGNNEPYRAKKVSYLIREMMDVVARDANGTPGPKDDAAGVYKNLTTEDYQNLGKFLKNQKVDLTRQDAEGHTPWSLTQTYFHGSAGAIDQPKNVFIILRAAGADPDQTNEKSADK